ncbi:MAG: flavodoxin family protein [Lewinella sp.]|uniref:flavodoxin family protein n=1 Tax=Lewinella sp. TaxID=2004506 RepID=UPI003D6C532E
MSSIVVFHASSRSHGNTSTIANYLSGQLSATAVNLSAHEIAPFSYEDNYPATDDFKDIIDQTIEADHWVLVTPIYWYTMSAQMKTFLDRFSDLMRYREELLPALTGKYLWTVAVGSDPESVPHFFTPFRLSAEYLAMYYGGDLHSWLGRTPAMKPEVQILLDRFSERILERVVK